MHESSQRNFNGSKIIEQSDKTSEMTIKHKLTNNRELLSHQKEFSQTGKAQRKIILLQWARP
jgi:hypothetical protein